MTFDLSVKSKFVHHSISQKLVYALLPISLKFGSLFLSSQVSMPSPPLQDAVWMFWWKSAACSGCPKSQGPGAAQVGGRWKVQDEAQGHAS